MIRGVGGVAEAASGNVVVPLPAAGALVAGDLIVVEAVTRDNVNLTCASADGSYTRAHASLPYRPNATQQTDVFIRTAIGGDATPTVTHAAGDSIEARMRVITAGTYDTGTPIDGTPAVTNTSDIIPSYSTTVADCLRMALIGMTNDTNAINAEVLGGLGVFEDWYDETAVGVSDIAAGGLSAADPVAGARAGTFTHLASATWAIQYAIRGLFVPVVTRDMYLSIAVERA